ncbi:hypothetical protein B0T10DRAFT_466198 [Thelonectria olida]|uniref:FAD dependent oxidoreductase domain-containing protein n=1 Tax=Thelonectria olida TaxID=1576542 RepID=A0A9P8VSE1_9HYPO|nr:hypothetical protein B0T10DRAFT_466198 [Thelonectria olida]
MVTKITILGCGISGMMAAAQLPRNYEITIVAEHMPGDYDTKEWASPYAGACWVGVHNSLPHEQKMQLEGFAGLWKLAHSNPESGARRIEMKEIMDLGAKEDVWYAGKLPDFRFLEDHELPAGARFGMTYKTVVISPQIFLSWLYSRLKDRGIKFVRIKVQSLGELKGYGHDILINASGFGVQTLTDVREKHLIPMRMQTVVIKNNTYNRLFIRRGPNNYYSTAFARMDGTVYVGGVLDPGALTADGCRDLDTDLVIKPEQRDHICRNAHLNQPDVFPSPNPKDWPILYDHVGVYPVLDRKVGGLRLEKEVLDGQRVIHVYGQIAGGYVYSFGQTRAVIELVNDFLSEIPASSKI